MIMEGLAGPLVFLAGLVLMFLVVPLDLKNYIR